MRNTQNFQPMYGSNGEIFEEVALELAVKGIDVNWMPNYTNFPDIIIEGVKDKLDAFAKGVVMCEIPAGDGNNIYYGPTPMGLVRYYCHSGDEDVNEGGFGGSTFTTILKDKVLQLKGPFSARASFVNALVPYQMQIVDILWKPKRGSMMSAAIKLPALLHLMHKYRAPFYLIQYRFPDREDGPIVASTSPTGYAKPEGGAVTNTSQYKNHSVVVHYDPNNLDK